MDPLDMFLSDDGSGMWSLDENWNWDAGGSTGAGDVFGGDPTWGGDVSSGGGAGDVFGGDPTWGDPYTYEDSWNVPWSDNDPNGAGGDTSWENYVRWALQNGGAAASALGGRGGQPSGGSSSGGSRSGGPNVTVPFPGASNGGGGSGGYTVNPRDILGGGGGGGPGGLGSGILNGAIDGSLLQLILGGAGGLLAMKDSDRMLNRVDQERDTLDPFGNQRPGYQDLMKRYYADPASVIEELPGYKAAMSAGRREIMRKAAAEGKGSSGAYPAWLQDRAVETAAKYSDTYEDNLRELTGAQFGPQSYASALMTALAAEQSGRNAAYDMWGQALGGLAGRNQTNINVNSNSGGTGYPGGASPIGNGVLTGNGGFTTAYEDYLRANGVDPNTFWGGGPGQMPIESPDGSGNNAAGGGGTGGTPDPTGGAGGPGDDGSLWDGYGLDLTRFGVDPGGG